MRSETPIPAEALAQIRAPLLAAGAQRVEPPLLQPLSLILDLAGEAMRERLFVVQAEGGAEACLRPDFTVAVASQHVTSQNGANAAAEGRYYYEGPAFRASQGADLAEEFLQLGVEWFAPAGAPGVEADAEIAALAWRAAKAGGRGDLSLWLGDVGLFAAFIESLALPQALGARLQRIAGRPRLLNAELARAGEPAAPAARGRLAALLAGLGEAEAADLLEEVWSLAGVDPVGGRGPAEIAARLVRRAAAADAPALTEAQASAIREFMAISDQPEAGLARVRELAGQGRALDQALEDWARRLERLDALAAGATLGFAPALGHAFDYYDGLTFEVRSAGLGPERPVAVGGRYDGLLARLGGAAGARAVGCMVRPARAFTGGEA
jgi:ATP phosphoribosyltransferase regulatory subunit